LRLAWQGANWDSDGNLFVYLDTQPGGTLHAYTPFTDGHTIHLPAEPATFAADTLVWVRANTDAVLLQWDGSAWISETPDQQPLSL
jgi:sugar lactone lactonase YvrE